MDQLKVASKFIKISLITNLVSILQNLLKLLEVTALKPLVGETNTGLLLTLGVPLGEWMDISGLV